MYRLDGTERVEKKTQKVPCGDLEATSYFHAETGELVRTDINVIVDPKLVLGATTGQ